MDFLRKEDMIRAIGEHHVHFVIFSPHKHNYNAWTFKHNEDCQVMNTVEEFVNAEYGFSEMPFHEKVGSCIGIHQTKKMISF